jgi:pimeloyl-ACP methyl ester carboxylesterase
VTPRRVWFWILDYLYAVRHQVIAVVRRTKPERFLSGDKAPVLLLPGVYETWAFLRPIAKLLHNAGHPVHVVPQLGRNRLPVSEAAAIAQKFIVDRELQGVVIVAHSKGGLIGKHMMLVDDTDGRIAHLVAIATPFGGSDYARFFPNRSIRAFLPTEKTLVMLGESESVNARVTSIFAEFDPHIPAGSALVGATNILVTRGGHFRVLSDPDVLDAVLAAAS